MEIISLLDRALRLRQAPFSSGEIEDDGDHGSGAPPLVDRARLQPRFSVMGHNPVVIFGVAFLLGVLPQMVFSYATLGLRLDLQQSGAVAGVVGIGFVTGLVGLFLQCLVQAVVVHAVVVDHDGGRAPLGESIVFGLGRAVPLIAVSILFFLALALGLLLLTVPFFFLATRWAVAPAAVIAERTGVIGAFGRSADLTAGARWKVLGLGILTIIFAWLIAAVAGVLSFGIFGLPHDPLYMYSNPFILGVNAIANTLTIGYWATMQVSLYVELRDWKDGPTTDRLAEIFR